MNGLGEFFRTLLAQFGGGPGSPENNLVRFGLAAIFWGILLLFAYTRQRQTPRPRERWLIIGFGLAFFRDLFMFSHLSLRLTTGAEHDALCSVMVPTEHALTLLSIVLISAAFLRYILDKQQLARRYLSLGVGLSAVATTAVCLYWPRQLITDPTVRFHTTWMAWFLHLLAAILIAVALVLLVRERGWLSNVVVLALTMIFVSECLVLVNLLTQRAYSSLLCPLGNNLYIWAIPVFGFVYYREQAHEKEAAEAALGVYRNHLEELVENRTAALTTSNARLQAEIAERKQIERDNIRLYEKTERWAQGMAELHAMSIELAASLDSAALNDVIVRQSAKLMMCPESLLFRWSMAESAVDLVAEYRAHGERTARAKRALIRLLQRHPSLDTEMRARRPFIIDPTEQDLHCDDERVPQDFVRHSLLCVPLQPAENSLYLLMLLKKRSPDCWEAHDVDLLENYASQATAALKNARLHSQLEITATLEERQRIAAEMHDGLAQTLSYLGLKTDRAAESLADGHVVDVLAEFGQIRSIIGRATQEVRHSIASLQSAPRPRQSLFAVLHDLTEEMNSGAPPTVKLVDCADATTVYLAAEELEHVTRVVTEALTNARRHAAAQQVVVQTARQGAEFSVSIKDDGLGFCVDAADTNRAGHFGLSIMQARAARIGGKLTIASSPDDGTQVTLAWSLQSDENASRRHRPTSAESTRASIANENAMESRVKVSA